MPKKLKPRYRRRIAWALASFFALLLLSLVVVPPFINTDRLREPLETALGVKINGDISLSLLGGATINARDVVMENGEIDSVMFDVPISKLFDIASVSVPRKISVTGARINAQTLTIPVVSREIEIYDSVVTFLGKNYEILGGTLKNGLLSGTVRTNQHRYEFDSNGDTFRVINKNEGLEITGSLFSDGGGIGTFKIDTDKFNEWFYISEPQLFGRVSLSMNFKWNGSYGFDFSDIRGTYGNGVFTGEIKLHEDGSKDIKLDAHNIDFDLSFLTKKTDILTKTWFDLDLSGRLRFTDKVFGNIKIDAGEAHPHIGRDIAQQEPDSVIIKEIIADDIEINGGAITSNGAQQIALKFPHKDKPLSCVFSGTPNNWKCENLNFDIFNNSYISFENGEFYAIVQSNSNMPNDIDFASELAPIGDKGTVKFKFQDSGGTVQINGTRETTIFDFINNRTIDWLGMDLRFLPDFMRTQNGNFESSNNGFSFSSENGAWYLEMSENGNFVLSGKNIKDLFPNKSLDFVYDLGYEISGFYNNGNISDLKIKIAGHEFTGTATNGEITLETELLDINAFVSQEYLSNYDELQYRMQEPIISVFDLGLKLSLNAKILVSAGNEYLNFTYSLKNNEQNFLIRDETKGSAIAKIVKKAGIFDISLKLNRFVINGNVLNPASLFNVGDSIVTAQIDLETSGQIAVDIWHNLAGNMDITFEDGIFVGLGTDMFYAGAKTMTAGETEPALVQALSGGTSALKTLRIVGEYKNEKLDSEINLGLRHVDGRGRLVLWGNTMSGNLDLILRGTSPSPSPLRITFSPRNYSLTEMLLNLDPVYLREFALTHEKF